jgi:hypothetical protein
VLVALKIRRLALIYIVLFGTFATLLVWGFNIAQQYELVKRGIHTKGFVAKLNCEQHNTVFYQFQVQGRDYQDLKKVEHCLQTIVGSPVDVYYLDGKPAASTAVPPADGLRSSILSILAIAFMASSAFVVQILRNAKESGSRK